MKPGSVEGNGVCFSTPPGRRMTICRGLLNSAKSRLVKPEIKGTEPRPQALQFFFGMVGGGTWQHSGDLGKMGTRAEHSIQGWAGRSLEPSGLVWTPRWGSI